MFFSKSKPAIRFKDQRDAVCQSDENYQALVTRRESVMAEIAVQEETVSKLRAELSNRMTPDGEVQAIAAGTLSATAGDPKAGREELGNTLARLDVLKKAAAQLVTEISIGRQSIGEKLYQEHFRVEQAEAAGKVIDALLDLAATRIEENHRLMDLQSSGMTILSLPRCAVRFATAALVKEHLANLQALGFKPSEAQAARLNGLVVEEARG